jgi:ankyrin repeat protein
MVMVLLGGVAFAQEAPKVDFVRDVQPTLQQHCVTCHGPSQQTGGLRLDRRRDALRGGTMGAVILPGNSERSRLYMKLVGTDFAGAAMPPAGPLPPGQIALVKAWIDQGAVWPDEAAGETGFGTPDRHAARLMRAIRAQDWRKFQYLLTKYPEAVKSKGIGGSTPLMYAALYGDAASVRILLERGADPNVRNDSGATALMWAIADVRKTRLLVDRGADVNVRSNDGRTPLLVAAGRAGSRAVLELLLARGANPNAKSGSLFGDMTPLAQAAYAGDADAIQLLLGRGADAKKAGPLPLALAKQSRCAKCVDLLVPFADARVATGAMLMGGPPFGDAADVKSLLDLGAMPNATSMTGHTMLMLAAASEDVPVESVKLLLERGADVNAKSPSGDTALSLARRHGYTPVADVLVEAGATKPAPIEQPALLPSHAQTPQAAVAKSLPLLQRSGATFLERSGCVSCHNNTLLLPTVASARASRLPVDEGYARSQVATIGKFIETWRERVLQGIGIPGDTDTISYILHGLAAERYAPTEATDAMAYYIKNRQLADGRWAVLGHRPPLEASDIQVTATSVRALSEYAPAAQRGEYQESIDRGAAWLAAAVARTNDELAFRLLGLAWSGMKREVIQSAARDLLSRQQPDGGWAQLPSMNSDAYATGQALVALSESGALDVKDPAYQRGVKFLLETQLADGSWFVKTRALPIQRQFDTGFPHGTDGWISAAATNWATTALAYAAQGDAKRGTRTNH